MNNRREKLRALLLTFVMVGSVAALGGLAASPAAAAPPAQEDVGADIPDYSVSNPGAYDIAVASGGEASDLPSELQGDFSDSDVYTDIDTAITNLGSGDNSILVTDDESEDADPAVDIDAAPEGSLTIASYEGPDSTTIEATGGAQNSIDIDLDSSTDLTIQGFTINGDENDAIDVQSELNSLTLVQNTVAAPDHDIQLLNAESAIGSVTLGFNTFDGGTNVGGPALDFYTTIDEVDINNNIFKDIGDTTALQFQGASDVAIQSNDFTDIGDEAVFAATDDSSATGTYQISQNYVSDVANSGGEGSVFGFYATGSEFSADITVENNVGNSDDENNGGVVNVEASGADVTSESITIQDNGFSDVDPGSGAANAVFDFDSGADSFGSDAGGISVTDVTIADNNVTASATGGPFVNVADGSGDDTTIDSLTVSASGNTVYDGGDNDVSGIVVSAGNGAVDSVTVDGVSFADLGDATALDLIGDGTTTATVTDLTVDKISANDVINLDDASLTDVTLDGVDATNVSNADGLDLDAADQGSGDFDLTFADTFSVDGVGDADASEKANDVVNLGADVQSNVEITNVEGSNVTSGVVTTPDTAVASGFALNINNVDFTDVGDTTGSGVGISVDDDGIGDLSVSNSAVTLDNAATGVDIQGVSSSSAQTSASVTGIDVTGSEDSADGVVVDLTSGESVASLTVNDISVTDVGGIGVKYGTADVGDKTVSLSNVAVDKFGSNSNEAGVSLVGTAALDEVAVDATVINNSGTGAAINVQSAVDTSILTLNGSEASSNGDQGDGINVQVDNIDTVAADSVTTNDNNNGIVITESGGTQDATVEIPNANIADNNNNGIDADISGTLTLNVEDSTISDNGADAVQLNNIDGDSVVDLSNNYWGDVTGPAIEDTGAGGNGGGNDLVSDDTRFANGGLIDDNGADSSGEFSYKPFLDADSNEVFGFDGVVQDPDENDLSGEDVTVQYEGANTQSSGSFTFEGTSAGGEFVAVFDDFQSTDQFESSVSVIGFGASDTQSFSVTGDNYIADQTGSPFVLGEGATLEGAITDPDGDVVANADNLQLIDADNGDVLVDGFTTNLQGEYTTSFSPGTYDLQVNHPNFDSSNVTENVELSSGNTTTANFQLSEDTTASFTATVNNESSGNALANTDVTFTASGDVPDSADAEFPTTQTTDSNGQVTFEVPAGDNTPAYTIEATASGFASDTNGVALAPGDSTSRTFNLAEETGPSPTGSVTFDDQTVTNGSETVNVANANYTLADGTAGDYVVVAHVVNDDDSISNPVGYSSNVTGDTDGIIVDLNASEAQGDALDTLTANTTLRAMLHETSSDSAFGPSLGLATDDANITVSEDPLPADFGVSGLDAPATVNTSESLTVNATITNNGGQEDTQNVTFRIGEEPLTDDDVVDSVTTEVTLASGASEDVSFDVTAPSTNGTFTHGVFTDDANQTATLTVQEDEDAYYTLKLSNSTADRGVQAATINTFATHRRSGSTALLPRSVYRYTRTHTGGLR